MKKMIKGFSLMLVLFMFVATFFPLMMLGSIKGSVSDPDVTSDTSLLVNGEYDIESSHYGDSNPYTKSGLKGQCTWFVWGRVSEALTIKLPYRMGDAGQWIYYAQWHSDTLHYGKTPKAGSIQVLGGSQYGHVAFVESVDKENNTMVISEGNVNNPHANDSYMVDYAKLHYDELVVTHEVEIKETYYDLEVKGYIYLDKIKAKEN